jgi:hypothetical protein
MPETPGEQRACPLKMLAVAQTAPINALPKAALGENPMFQCLGPHCAWWDHSYKCCSIITIAGAMVAQVQATQSAAWEK